MEKLIVKKGVMVVRTIVWLGVILVNEPHHENPRKDEEGCQYSTIY